MIPPPAVCINVEKWYEKCTKSGTESVMKSGTYQEGAGKAPIRKVQNDGQQ